MAPPPQPAKSAQEISAEHFKIQGNSLFGRGNYTEAIQAYSTAIINNPRVAAYFTNRALCYVRLERWGDAAEDSRKAIELDKDSVKGHYYLGMSLTEGLWERFEKEEERARAREARELDERVRRDMGEMDITDTGRRQRDQDEDDEELSRSDRGVEISGSLSEAVDELTFGWFAGRSPIRQQVFEGLTPPTTSAPSPPHPNQQHTTSP